MHVVTEVQERNAGAAPCGRTHGLFETATVSAGEQTLAPPAHRIRLRGDARLRVRFANKPFVRLVRCFCVREACMP